MRKTTTMPWSTVIRVLCVSSRKKMTYDGVVLRHPVGNPKRKV
jgi:hypothetical protein